MCCYSPTYSRVSAPTGIASYDLDPAHYFTLPSFTWDAMLKYTGVRLELLTDVGHVTVRGAWHTRRSEPVFAQVRACQQQAPACWDVRRVEVVDVSDVLSTSTTCTDGRCRRLCRMEGWTMRRWPRSMYHPCPTAEDSEESEEYLLEVEHRISQGDPRRLRRPSILPGARARSQEENKQSCLPRSTIRSDTLSIIAT